MTNSANKILVHHLGPVCQGGMKSVIDLLNTLDLEGVDSDVLPTYAIFKAKYLRNISVFVKALIVVALAIPRQNRIYQLHTSKGGSVWRKYLISILLRMKQEKYVVHLHGSMYEPYLNSRNFIKNYIFKSYLKHAGCVVVLADVWKEYFQRKLPDGIRFSVICNPCETILEYKNPKKTGIEVKFLYAGMFTPKKGVFDLLKAFSMSEIKIPMELHLFGASGGSDFYRAIDEINDKRIYIHDWVDHATFLNMLQKFDVFVLPSFSEGLPMSILEAMGAGLPIVATDVGAITDAVVHKHNGIIFEPGDIACLKQAIVDLGSSAELREQYGRASLEIVKTKFSIDMIKPKWQNLYTELR